MTGSIRLFVNAPLRGSATIETSVGQAHYLGHVMRRAVGDPVLVFNGQDGEWHARVATIRRDRAWLEIGTQARPQAPDPDLHLLFAPLRRATSELVVEKATELGVSRIRPVTTARTTPVRLNRDRLVAIATEAAEQCERLTVPEIAATEPLDAALRDWPADRRLTVLMERSAAPPVVRGPSPAGLLVGPEGGFTPAELDALHRTPFVVAASLGPRILRAETAAIAGLALLLCSEPTRAVGRDI